MIINEELVLNTRPFTENASIFFFFGIRQICLEERGHHVMRSQEQQQVP